MPDNEPKQVSGAALTALLNRMQIGDREAANKAAELVYGELHHIAAAHMRGERRGHLLQATALVNEVCIKLLAGARINLESRGQFFALASRQMRHVLVDCARNARARKRGANVPHDDIQKVNIGVEGTNVDIILLHESLLELEKFEARAAQIVELKFFGGYTDKEVAAAMGISLATVRRDWEYARSWLFARMRDGVRSA